MSWLRENWIIFSRDIPKKVQSDFEAEDAWAEEKMEQLKQRIRTSGIETFDG